MSELDSSFLNQRLTPFQAPLHTLPCNSQIPYGKVLFLFWGVGGGERMKKYRSPKHVSSLLCNDFFFQRCKNAVTGQRALKAGCLGSKAAPTVAAGQFLKLSKSQFPLGKAAFSAREVMIRQ